MADGRTPPLLDKTGGMRNFPPAPQAPMTANNLFEKPGNIGLTVSRNMPEQDVRCLG